MSIPLLLPDSLRGLRYWIMDGAGNDFVIVDLRKGGTLDADAASYLGDRRGAFGCDQIITLEPLGGNEVGMGIFNADGSRAGACGNASRCVARLLGAEDEDRPLRFLSPSGWLEAKDLGGGVFEIDMGAPRLRWQDIPLSQPLADTLALPIEKPLLDEFALAPPAAVSMGNPHAVFFVEDAARAPLERFGPVLETHPLFPDRANISAASAEDGGFRVRTWERGVGITRACGTAACAVLVAAVLRGLTSGQALIRADGGDLAIRWGGGQEPVFMAGPTRLHAEGTFDAG
jgi:diaminopimelate epimerase